ncbi:precorrin-2 dehydrogenase/sirohydrochlorin ferrochelatase family protein [Paenibacillus arenilitoris]|uniref:precorrin-2 dehydrogenase n=1 Tax=Paenibacillus arenilitoris TaxID=2772299 RepID=A0A927H7B1_9BACL|nr:bifunctional precorrin-2 dehydrogenase/sirohydrochlorin ferrochelatase [Paenibacillus arenilitoris]MBD2870468.1 bifunctional precorrin-2 dehydrogenase/sirohydrochlorin ferrochelatase [Paenibacillus arenilitoris]
MNGYYPVVLQLRGKRCVIVGGGGVAQRKLLGLLEAGADQVTVISPDVTPAIGKLAEEGVIRTELREYEEADSAGAWLLFAATNDRRVNAAIAADGERHGALVNAADEAERGTFISPSVVRRGDLLLAVTASGASPALSQLIKTELAERYGPEYEQVTARLRSLREKAVSRLPDERQRRIVLKLAAEEALQRHNRSNIDADEWLTGLLHRLDRGQP